MFFFIISISIYIFINNYLCLISNKAGLWGWRSDKSEVVNGHECKVFSACNVELITKTRLEHLSESDKARARAPRTPLQSFLGMAEQQQENSNSATTSVIFFSYIFLFYIMCNNNEIHLSFVFRKNIIILEILLI